MNCSIFFSMHMLWMTKKIRYFLRYFVIGERIFPWFTVNPIPSPKRDNSWWRTGRFFFVVLLLPLIGMQNLSHPVLTHILRAELLEFLAHCCSISSQTCLIHEKFWPRCEYCLCSSRTWFWSQLHIYCASNWLQLPIRAQSLCSLGSVLMVLMLFLLLEECIHVRPLQEIVKIMQCLLSWSTVQCQQHSEILRPFKICSICLVVTAFQFVLHICCNRRSLLAGSSQSKGTSVLITLSMSEELDGTIITVSPFFHEGFHTLHISQRLLLKDWAGLQRQLCEK